MPTALELTREQWQPYIDAARRRPAPPESSSIDKGQRERLLARAREVSLALKTRYGVRRVVLFGSSANPDWFRSDSDVDLAVEGLTADNFWQAWRLAEDMIGDRPVDLIEIETAKTSLLRAIERYGIEL